MATEQNLQVISALAGADLSSNQYYAVKQSASTDNYVTVAAEGEKAIGVLQNKPSAAGRAANVAIGGVTKAVAGGSVTRGDRVVNKSDGTLVTVGSGDDWSLGVALESASSGAIFKMLIQPTGPTI